LLSQQLEKIVGPRSLGQFAAHLDRQTVGRGCGGDGVDAAGRLRRPDTSHLAVGEVGGDCFGLARATVVEGTFEVIEVPTASIEGRGVADEMKSHRSGSVGRLCGADQGRADSVLMGFFDRNRKALEQAGIDPARLPPGQYHTDRFPVLHVGSPMIYADDLSDWDLRIFGLVEEEITLDFAALTALEVVDVVTDIHCVTKWSKFDTAWTGVRLRDLYAMAGVAPAATHVVMHGEHGYSANLPLEHTMGDNILVTWAYDGLPLEVEHGFPVRTLVPHLYFWKSVKWLRGIELVDQDQPGFWEQNGYHMLGEPFAEQRFWGD